MADLTYQLWATGFRREARSDKYAAMRVHLRRLGLRAKSEKIVDGTIEVVLACMAYLKMDGRPLAPFLAMQVYSPVQALGAKYTFTFNLAGKAYARVVVDRNLRGLDLADLYGYPIRKYRTCGYTEFWITRVDGKALTKREAAHLEREVTRDLRFDYTEHELGFWFDDSLIAGSLYINLYQPEPS